VISGVHCNVDEIHAFLGYYAMLNGNALLTFWDSLLVLEDGTNTLSQDVGKGLPFDTA
jgi:hypothetical protein